MISNSQVAHNFAHNVKENKHSNSMFWESRNDGTRRIYSYGHHFCIAIIDPAADVVLFTTRGYSNTTSKHILEVRRALYQNNIIRVYDPEAAALDNLKQYAAEIKSNFDHLKRSQTRAAFYCECIKIIYKNAQKYANYKNITTEFAPVVAAYADYFKYSSTPEFAARLESQERRAAADRERREAIQAERRAQWEKEWNERRENERLTSAERVAKWESGANVYLKYDDTEENVPLRLASRKGYKVIETGKGVIIPLNEAQRVAALVLAGSFEGLTVNDTYKIIEHDAEHVKIGCHRFKMDYLKEWAEKVKAL